MSGHPNIVDFIDFSYNKISSEAYEMLILMEYCPGGHLVDYLNTRLEERLSESEILRIFSDICLGVAHLHSMTPKIAHRDIKIENVLLKANTFKLCDFGSCTTISHAANSMSIPEIRILDIEIQKLTTVQYRAPEMCDLYQNLQVSEKADIWVLFS